MEPVTRLAAAADIPAIEALVGAALAELGPTRGGDLWLRQDARALPAHESLTAALTDPDQFLVVGLIDDVVLGYAAARIDQVDDETRLAIVDDVYVDIDARGVGIGHAVLDSVIGWARDRGCTGVDGRVLPGNRAGKNFFETAGMVARAILVHRSLAPGGDEASVEVRERPTSRRVGP